MIMLLLLLDASLRLLLPLNKCAATRARASEVIDRAEDRREGAAASFVGHFLCIGLGQQ